MISVFGRRGSGKTSLCAEIAEQFERVIIYDTRARIDTHNSFGADCYIPGAIRIMGDFEKLVEALVKNKRSYKIIFTPLNPEDDFELFCELCNSKEINDALVVIEEVGLVTKSSAFGMPEAFNKLLRFGRHHGLHILTNAQRPCDVHRSITANSSHIICFSQTEPRDLAYLTGFFGSTTDRIRTLKKYNFICWHDGNIEMYDQNRKKVTLESAQENPRPEENSEV